MESQDEEKMENKSDILEVIVHEDIKPNILEIIDHNDEVVEGDENVSSVEYTHRAIL